MNGRDYGYQYAEAYCIMKYRSDDGTEEEWIWNSRDGVTPFVVTLRSGKQAKHVDWHEDTCAPHYKPLVGSRMFVDLTRERSLEIARANAKRYWSEEAMSYNPQTEYASQEDLAKALAASYLQREGTPDLVEVTA